MKGLSVVLVLLHFSNMLALDKLNSFDSVYISILYFENSIIGSSHIDNFVYLPDGKMYRQLIKNSHDTVCFYDTLKPNTVELISEFDSLYYRLDEKDKKIDLYESCFIKMRVYRGVAVSEFTVRLNYDVLLKLLPNNYIGRYLFEGCHENIFQDVFFYHDSDNFLNNGIVNPGLYEDIDPDEIIDLPLLDKETQKRKGN